MSAAPRSHPVSTYRLQLHGGFGFDDARAAVEYLARLGITDCYTSPHLKANPGSAHGYDICDHGLLNPDLGTPAEYERFTAELRRLELGHIVDIVPNHMAADPVSNLWWRNVLENGRASPYSDFFDIDWHPIKPELEQRVLLPVLGDQYGRVLERGDLRLQYDQGTLALAYGASTLPLDPRELPRVLALESPATGHALDEDDADAREYLSILTALSNLPPRTDRHPDRVAERQREKEVARERLDRLAAASAAVREHIDACVRAVNGTPGDPASFDALHDLLDRQAYRLAYWRTAFDEVNYRRFFDINGLVALRMEEPRVFDATHALLRDLVAGGHVTGFRVDHPDGLFDPQTYLERLQAMAQDARPAGGQDARAPFYVVVEKILSPGEALSPDWPVAGTTGYDFLNLVGGLFIDGRHARPLRRVYGRLTGRQATFAEVAYQSKRVITLTSMASELSVLAHDLNRLSEADRRYRDFTLDSCRKALREVLACLPVYRTYVTDRGWRDFDRTVIEAAIEEAQARNPVMEESIFAFIHEALLPEAGRTPRFAMKFQQFSGPVQAKGVEDTAFYRYHVLVAANDVGGHPGHLGVTAREFHDANARRSASQPFSMLATATHDTKRGEDARARLSVISERPDEWRRAVSEWMRMNSKHRTRLGSSWAPDRNDEYLFYQAALGAWPAEHPASPIAERAPDPFVARIDAYMQKAVREAKVHTSWIDQDQAYGQAVARFVQRVFTGPGAPRFLASFVAFARRIAGAGAVNSLAQVTLKLASPGVADFYQGTELWDFSLVDPDNRRPVDFIRRHGLLDELEPLLSACDAGTASEAAIASIAGTWPDGRIKLLITACGLRFRRDQASFLAGASYVPLQADGPAADHVVAFARQAAAGSLVAVAPRLVSRLMADGRMPLGEVWEGTTIELPGDLGRRPYRQLFTGGRVQPADGAGPPRLQLAEVFRTTPVALLWSAVEG